MRKINLSPFSMSKDADFEEVGNLVDRLIVHRSSGEENKLCQLTRLLSGEEKLTIIKKLGVSNVRLAASVASRIKLPVEQQLTLVSHLISDGKSNAIKYFTIDFFVFRLSARALYRALKELKDRYPDSVRLMAYYYMSSAKFAGHRDRESFNALMDGAS